MLGVFDKLSNGTATAIISLFVAYCTSNVPLLVIGGLLDIFVLYTNGICTLALGGVGLLLYAYAVVLSVLTLKTEKKAQNRAYEILERDYQITSDELSALKELFHLYIFHLLIFFIVKANLHKLC